MKEVTQVHWVLLVTAVLLDQLDSQVNLGLLVQVAQLDHLALEETQAPLVAQEALERPANKVTEGKEGPLVQQVQVDPLAQGVILAQLELQELLGHQGNQEALANLDQLDQLD